MNLVIDDAVEVKQITKTNDKETRRHLGTISASYKIILANLYPRPDPVEGRQRVINPKLGWLMDRAPSYGRVEPTCELQSAGRGKLYQAAWPNTMADEASVMTRKDKLASTRFVMSQ